MSLSSALNTAVSALRAQSAALSSVSQNIANSSTTAYKDTGVSFQAMVTGSGTSQTSVTGGVVYSTYQNMTSQGLIEATDVSTNIAISGDGFFVVSDATDNLPSGYNYSRNGSFSTDASGYLLNSEGYYLMGWATDADGNVSANNTNDLNSLEPVSVTAVSGSAKATQNVAIEANLPADAAIGDSFTMAFEVFDALGISHTVDQTWTKTAANEWEMSLSDPYLTSDSSVTTGTLTPSTATVTFNGDGSLAGVSPSPLSLSITGFTTGADDSAVAIDLGTVGRTDGLTQYSSNSTTAQIEIFNVDNDGVRYGQLTSIEINDEGLVTALFDNGLRQPIYQIPVATFSNPNGLTHINGTVYDENQYAGNVNLNYPGGGSAGSIVASALEQSTVDTSEEFSRMIIAQQAYSSASQVISTTSDMFDTLISAVR